MSIVFVGIAFLLSGYFLCVVRYRHLPSGRRHEPVALSPAERQELALLVRDLRSFMESQGYDVGEPRPLEAPQIEPRSGMSDWDFLADDGDQLEDELDLGLMASSYDDPTLRLRDDVHFGVTINPASGLPMLSDDLGGLDVGGNTYGTSGLSDDTFGSSFESMSSDPCSDDPFSIH